MLHFKDSKVLLRKNRSGERLEVLIAGDCCPWDKAIAPIRAGKSSEILSAIKPVLDDCDLSVVQFETPLTNAETPIVKSGPNLKCPPECVDFVKAGGFDIAALANNHIGDFGPEPVMETIEILKRNGIQTVGAGKNLAAAKQPLFISRKGMQIAFINIAENEFGTATPDKPGAAPLDPLDNITLIHETAATADHVIVIMHGGNERNPVPSPRVIKTCHAFAEAGAHAIIHIHAHCPQGIEVWKGVPIFYSPGNFYFPSPWRQFEPESFWWTGFIIKLAFDRQAAFGLEIIPYTFGYTPEKIVPLTGDKKAAFCNYMTKISKIIQDPDEVKRYFDGWCAWNGPDAVSNIRKVSALWPMEHRDPVLLQRLMPLRNYFTCEAHHELVTNFLRMVETDRIKEAETYIPEIQKLQIADF
jgi:poly-gamma-glutamate synthesis protein (capsule biosynthesis protein)